MGLGKRALYLTLHCRYKNDSYMKMGRDESHFYVLSCEGQRSQEGVRKLAQLSNRKDNRNGFEPTSTFLSA